MRDHDPRPRKSKVETTPERSRLMARVRRSGTSAELIVRDVLKSLGRDFEVEAKDLPGNPDIVNRGAKWAIFVHGCFWHAHEGCCRCTIPKTNRDYWLKKFAENRARDENKKAFLKGKGYSVLVVWECETEDRKALEGKICEFLNDVSA